MDKVVKGRKIKRVVFSGGYFQTSLKSGLVFEIEKGLPEGAQFRGFVVDDLTNNLVIFFEHESFEMIPFDQIPPIIEMKFLKRDLPNV